MDKNCKTTYPVINLKTFEYIYFIYLVIIAYKITSFVITTNVPSTIYLKKIYI